MSNLLYCHRNPGKVIYVNKLLSFSTSCIAIIPTYKKGGTSKIHFRPPLRILYMRIHVFHSAFSRGNTSRSNCEVNVSRSGITYGRNFSAQEGTSG